MPEKESPQPPLVHAPVATSWDEAHENQKLGRYRRPSEGHGKLILTIVVIFLVVCAAGAAYLYFHSRTPPPDIQTSFSTSDSLMAGQPFTLTVTPANDSVQTLTNVRLSLLLPDGVYFVGQPSEQRFVAQTINNLNPETLDTAKFQLISTADNQNDVKRVQATLTYDTTAQPGFDQTSEFTYDISFPRAAVDLAFNTPQTVFSGQDFTMTLTYQNNTQQPISGLQLLLNLPPQFQLSQSNLPATTNGNEWDLATMAAGESDQLTLTGSLNGNANASYPFQATLTGSFSGQSYVLNTQSPSITIGSAPLAVSILLQANGGNGYIAHPGDALTYQITYQNNSTIALNDVSIQVTPQGSMFDLAAAKTSGSFDSVNNIFTWTAADTPALASVAPQQQGTVTLVIPLANTFPIQSASDKDYSVSLQGTINSPSVPAGTSAQQSTNIASVSTKVEGDIEIQAEALWRDAASKIVNQGPFPPKVNTPTQYTIHWIVSNHADDMTNLKITANLLSGSSWTGVVQSNISTQPSYDSGTGKVEWDIPQLPANIGIAAPPAEAVFQISMTPAVNQVGSIVPLLSQTNLTANDTFTGDTLTANAQALDTSLPNDPTVTSLDPQVVQ